MKLKNKETGESYETTMPIVFNIKTSGGGEHTVICESIKILNERWEDVPEEPKKFWWINDRLTIYESEVRNDTIWLRDACKQIGNYFLSKEEAEKSVEKLKAWKRLKDKGFSIYSWGYEFDMVDKPTQTIILRASAVDSNNTDLDLLFGGEE